jgi:hypothetical protein
LDRDIVGMVIPILTVAEETNRILPPQFSNQGRLTTLDRALGA